VRSVATFSLRSAEQGAADSQVLVPASFTIIAGTVLLSGLGACPSARRLGLIDESYRPMVILGTNPLAVAFAEAFESQGVPTRLISLDRREVSTARLSGLAAVPGSVLDEGLWTEVERSGATNFVALSGSDKANVIACGRVALLAGRRNVFRVSSDRREHAVSQVSVAMPGRLLIDARAMFNDLEERIASGWRFRSTRLTEVFGEDDYRSDLADGSLLVGVIRPSSVDLAVPGQPMRLRAGDKVVALVPGNGNGLSD